MDDSTPAELKTAQSTGIHRRIGMAALILGGGILLSRFAGFLRDMAIASLYGATAATAAYYAAFTLPDLLNYMLAAGALSISFVPIFSRHLATGHEERGWKCFSITFTIMTATICVMTATGWILAPRLVPLLVPRFSPELLATTTRITRIILPAQIFFIAGGILSATLYARKRFIAPALAPLVYNLFIITGGVVLHPWCGIDGFAWGVLAGAVAGPFLVPLVASRRRIRYRPSFRVTDPDFLAFLKMAIPLMLGFSLLTVDEWLARYFASGSAGVITHINNARRLMLVPTAVLAFAAGTAALPFLAQLHAQGRIHEMGEALGKALRGVAQVSIVASGALASVALPAVALVFGRGRFTDSDVQQTAILLVLFCAGIGAWGIQGVAARGFYAMSDTLTPMLVGSVVAAASALGYGTLWHLMGPPGLPLAASLGMSLTALTTLWWLHRRKVPYHPKSLLGAVLRAYLAAGVAFAMVRWVDYGLRGVLDPHQHLHAIILCGILGGLYTVVVLLLARPLGLPHVAAFPSRLLQKFRRKNTSPSPTSPSP